MREGSFNLWRAVKVTAEHPIPPWLPFGPPILCPLLRTLCTLQMHSVSLSPASHPNTHASCCFFWSSPFTHQSSIFARLSLLFCPDAGRDHTHSRRPPILPLLVSPPSRLDSPLAASHSPPSTPLPHPPSSRPLSLCPSTDLKTGQGFGSPPEASGSSLSLIFDLPSLALSSRYCIVPTSTSGPSHNTY